MRQRFQSIIRFLLIVTVFFSSTGVSPLALAQSARDQAGYEDALAQLTAVMDLIDEMQSLLDRTLFELEALEFEMVFEEADFIADWVRSNIAYQPYHGVLRGAGGTLSSGAGNSFDQSLLLGSLLNAAGYEARMLVGQLPDEAARALLATAGPAADNGVWRAAAIDAMTALDGFGAVPGLDLAAIKQNLEELLDPYAVDEQLYGEAASAAQQLTEFLAGEGVSLGAGAADPALLEAAAEHAWVEYRLASTDQWQVLDVTLPAGLELPEAETVVDEDVPVEFLHRVRIEAFVEAKAGDEFDVSEVITARVLPTANLNGTVLSYTNIPNGLAALGSEAPLDQVLDATDFFIPFVDESMAPGAMGFDLEGAVLEPNFLADQAAGVFRNVRAGFSAATSLLGGLGMGDSEPEEPLALTGHWLQYTLIAPGGAEETHTRMIVDRRGAAERAAGGDSLAGQSREEAELALLHEERLMVITGEYRPEWLLDQFFTRFLNTRTFLEYALAINHGIEPDVTVEEAIDAASPLEHLFAAAAFDAGARHGDSVAFRSAPSLLSFVSSLAGTRADTTAVTRLDIVTNARTVLADSPASAAGQALAQGVWETFVERDITLAAAAAESGVIASFSAAQAFASAAAGGLLLLRPGDDTTALAVGAEAAGNIRADLERGYHVILPLAREDGREAWYRVDAATGETLGVTYDARGQAMTEYQIQLTDQTLTMLFALKSFDDCQKNYAPASPALACCFVKAHVNNIMGLGFGNGISAVYGSAMGLLFTVMTGVGGADFVGPALDCDAFA